MRKLFVIFLVIPILIASCEKKAASNSDNSNAVLPGSNDDNSFALPSACEG